MNNKSSKRILIIDDDPQINLMVAEFLQRSGYAVSHCADGERGLQIVESFKPDLILCDLDMPVMNGWTLVSKIRENDHSADLPVIFLSACRDRAKIRQSINLGGDDFLAKPLDLAEILQAVEARLQRKQKEHQRVSRKMRSAIGMISEFAPDSTGRDTRARLLSEAGRSGGLNLPGNGQPDMVSMLGNGSARTSYFMAKINNRQQFVKLSEVKAFTAYGEYSQAFWGGDQKMLFRKPLKQWIKELPPETFVRIHRQSIVNLNFFSYMDTSAQGNAQLHLKGFPHPLPVSQRCAPNLNRLLKQFQPQT